MVDWVLLPKQMEYLKLHERECLYSGSWGAGKSIALCLKLVQRASQKGARELLARKCLVNLKMTTLLTLLQGDGQVPPILPMGTYTHEIANKTIRLNKGGSIVYMGLDEPTKLGSMQLTGAAVDECAELDEQDWIALKGRLRITIYNLRNQLYGACNPSSPSHFLATRFGITSEKAMADTACILTKSSDNWYLSQDYLDSLNTITGIAKRRYVEGLWVASDNMVYSGWNRSDFMQERKVEQGKWDRTILACDIGFSNPSAFLLIRVDWDNRIHIEREFYKNQQTETDLIARLQDWHKEYNPEAILVDPSQPGFITTACNQGLPCKGANNEVVDGIQRVRDQMVMGGDGYPRFTVDPTCTNLMKELESYEVDPDTDKPIKAMDHACDAMRYGLAYLKPRIPAFQRSTHYQIGDRYAVQPA